MGGGGERSRQEISIEGWKRKLEERRKDKRR